MESSEVAVGKFLDPEAILKQIKVSAGSIVADFGCGPGYFSIPFAKIAGEHGKVYSLDVLPQALESLKSKTKNSGIINIVAQRVNLENTNGSKLEDNLADWIILKDILFQNQKKEQIIKEAFRVLKPGGKVLVIEWNQKDASFGPEFDLRILPENLEKMLEVQNFTIEQKIDAGDFHYAFVAVKQSE